MEIPAVIIAVGALVFLAHFFSWLFSFTRIPDALLLMAIGIVLGPVFGIVLPDFFGEAGHLFVLLMLVVILFEGATKLKFVILREAWKGTFSLAATSFFLTMAGTGLLLWTVTDLHPIAAFLIGAILGDNAAAIVVPLIQKLKMQDRSRTILFLESGLSDVLSIVFTLALITSLELGVFRLETVAFDIAASFTAAVLFGVLCALLWATLLNKVHRIQNSAFATPAFVFMVFGITEIFEYSGLLAVIAFGIVLGNMPLLISSLEKKHQLLYTIFRPSSLTTHERSFFSEIVFLLQTFFFLYVGISLTFGDPAILLLGLLLTVIIFLIRLLAVRLSVPRSIPKFDASIMAITAPRGLATAVLALIPLQRGLPEGQFIQEITWTVVFFSIAFTSILVFLLYNTQIKKAYAFALPSFAPNPDETPKSIPQPLPVPDEKSQ